MKILSGILDLLFPPRRVCPLCGEFQEECKICPGCRHRLSEYSREPICFRCGRYFLTPQEAAFNNAQPENNVICRDCLGAVRYFQMARSAGPYEGDIRKAVRRLKFSGKRDLAVHLSGVMFQSMFGNPLYSNIEIIAAVPLSTARLRERGFNQADLLAHGIAARMAAPLLPVLRKVRDTRPQTSLNRAGRKENLLGAFCLTEPGAVRGKNILLVDDVITTANTLNNVSEVLVRGGASRVVCIAAAAGRTTVQQG